MSYAHTQSVPPAVLTAGGALGFIASKVIPNPLIRIASLGVLALAGTTFRSLTIEVDTDRVRLLFGDGLLEKDVKLADVESVKQTRTNAWQGWGVHWIGNGWLYNVYGLAAVELKLKDGKVVVIGTDEPTELTEAINEQLRNRRFE
ncbi:MAG TPA: hypothetical protein V6C69_04890 [Trichormus sp.]|jgi:hypothetical protein